MHAHALLILLLLLTPLDVGAEPVVVVSAHTREDRLSQDEVVNIFMGRYRRLHSGMAAVPIDQPGDSDLKAEFYRRLVDKSISDINAYWARLVFSGKTSPPRPTSSPADVARQVASLPGAIAYLERSQVDARHHIVFEFSRAP